MTVLSIQLPPRRQYVVSVRGARGPEGPPGAGNEDHGDLNGLADDDHTQYHTDARGDARYYTQGQTDTALAGKASTSHTHAQSDVTGLVSALSGKAASSHTHAQSDITGLTAALAAKADDTATTSALALKADLVGGYIPSAQIPAIAITEYLGSVATEGAMLALVGDQGDWCIRTDSATAWVLSADDSSLIGSWIQIPHPQSPVLSVNGQTGVITLDAADVSAQAASGSLTATITTNTPTGLTGLLVGNGTDVDVLESTTNGHVLRVSGGAKGWGTLDATSIGAGAVSDTEFGYLDGVTSALQTQIDGKAASTHTHAQSDITGLVTDLAAKQAASGNLTATITNSTPTNLTGVPVFNGSTVTVQNSTNNAHIFRISGGVPVWSTITGTSIQAGTILDGVINAGANINATKLGTGAVDNTEFNYLNGGTENIQTRLDSLKVETTGIHDTAPVVGVIYLDAKAQVARTINGLYGLKTTSGTCTLSVKINGTAVTGLSALSVTSTAQDATATALNTVAASDVVTLEYTAVSSPVDLRATLKATRT